MPDRIKSMVFLDAYIQQDGKSAFDLLPGLRDVYEQRSLKDKGREWLVLSYTPEEFGVTFPDDVSLMASRLCPMPFHTHDEPLTIQNTKSWDLSKTYITFTDFGDSMFKSVVSGEADAWNYLELRRGHDAMITAPNELSKLLLEIIGKKKLAHTNQNNYAITW